MRKLSILLCTIVIISVSCGDKSNEESNDQLADKPIVGKRFSVEDYNFAIKENGKFIQYNKAIYQRGDEIFFVLSNVGRFSRGNDSLNRAEMTMEIKNAVGEVISARRELFGSRGHGDFKQDILKSPYASYTSDSKDKPGKYSICVTIYDLIVNDSIVIEDDFYIE